METHYGNPAPFNWLQHGQCWNIVCLVSLLWDKIFYYVLLWYSMCFEGEKRTWKVKVVKFACNVGNTERYLKSHSSSKQSFESWEELSTLPTKTIPFVSFSCIKYTRWNQENTNKSVPTLDLPEHLHNLEMYKGFWENLICAFCILAVFTGIWKLCFIKSDIMPTWLKKDWELK